VVTANVLAPLTVGNDIALAEPFLYTFPSVPIFRFSSNAPLFSTPAVKAALVFLIPKNWNFLEDA